MKAYHDTTRERAVEILAHGLGEQDVVYVAASMEGVRLLADPRGDFNPTLRFHVTGLWVDGEDVWLPPPGEPDLDPRVWERMPTMPIHDPIGDTVLELDLPDGSLDAYRYEEQVTLWNRDTNEIRHTDHFAWGGEWLAPLEVVSNAPIRMLERRLDEEEEDLLDRALAKARTALAARGHSQDQIEALLARHEEAVRKWEPAEGDDA
ncbi:MAG: hypothetical protein ACREM1_06710 [Longimicrobiales bacterium]